MKTDKKDILWKANYRYDFDRDLFINREARKAFSLEFVSDKTEQELQQRIEERTASNGWTFYFNSAPSSGAMRELERALG